MSLSIFLVIYKTVETLLPDKLNLVKADIEPITVFNEGTQLSSLILTASRGYGPIQEMPPELVLAYDFTVLPTEKSDIW